MDVKADKWIRIFDISDVSKHTKGFTIYKVISMLYPKNCPDSVTKVTVWKRYNDFKKLHRTVKSQHKLLKIKEKYPSLPNTSYFRRFDYDVIQQRRQNIMKFLTFLASHPQLFALDMCVQFFKTSYTPCILLNSNIHSIRAELNLPIESDYDLVWSNSDDDRTISDTDSISTLSSTIDQLPDPLTQPATSVKSHPKLEMSLTNSITSSNDSLSISLLEGSTNLDGQVFLTPPHTPNSLSLITPTHYIFEALQYITHAVECEVAKKYEDSFTAYKAGINVLLKNVRDDKDFDRKQMIRHKIEKYLLRAEKIYNMYLSSESKTLQNYTLENEEREKEAIEESVKDLYKYKVLKVIATGMLVLHSDSQQLFYIKVIHKTSKCANDKLVLPGNVPYMVKLYNYYNCENALFLVLQYCSGTKLKDYMKQKLTNSEDIFSTSFCSNTMYMSFNREDYCSESDSDHSYSDLIQDYTSNRIEKINMGINSLDLDEHTEDVGDELNCIKEENDRPGIQLNSIEEISEIIIKSQELISSVDTALQTDVKIPSHTPKSNGLKKVDTPRKSSRKSSEMSDWSMFDDFHIAENTLLPIQDVIKWAAQLLLALERLHLFGIVCCYLDSKHILIDEYGDLILTYMCNVTEKYDHAFNITNDLTFAPEMRTFDPVTDAADWWSLGAILFEMLVGMPLKTVHPDGVSTYTILKIPKYVSVEGRSLLKQLLVYEPHERLGYGVNGADDIKSHPFFNSVSWDGLALKGKM